MIARTALLWVVALATGANAFVNNAPRVPFSTKLYPIPAINDALSAPIKDLSYGEESRKYRRTVYTHDDWVKHRSSDRIFRYTFAIFSSGIYKNIGAEISTVTAIAAFTVLWNAMAGTYTDFSGVVHDGLLSGVVLDGLLKNTVVPILSLPLAPFSLLSTSLGLLLGKFLL